MTSSVPDLFRLELTSETPYSLVDICTGCPLANLQDAGDLSVIESLVLPHHQRNPLLAREFRNRCSDLLNGDSLLNGHFNSGLPGSMEIVLSHQWDLWTTP
jgi:hypothetical protein